MVSDLNIYIFWAATIGVMRSRAAVHCDGIVKAYKLMIEEQGEKKRVLHEDLFLLLPIQGPRHWWPFHTRCKLLSADSLEVFCL